MPDDDKQRLERAWHDSLTPPDTREIWEWIHAEGELPRAYAVPGRFDITLAPFTKPIFQALKNRRVRKVTSMSSVQSLKTLIGELWLIWLIINDPGPTQWVQPDDQEAKEHAEERFNKLIECFLSVARHYTENRHEKKTVSIMFKHMMLRMEGANNEGNAQRKSVKNQMCSELWQAKKWKPGRLSEFASRMTQFTFNSKRYVESQPGMASYLKVDDMHATYLEGSQKLLHFRCLGCGKAQPWAWTHLREDDTRAGMRWDVNARTKRETNSTDPNQIWNWENLRQTIRIECIYCGHAHHDEPVTRRRMMDSWLYVSQRAEEQSDGPPAFVTHESFSWNQLVMPNLSWFETEIGGVKKFLIAKAEAERGDDRLQRQFFQKVIAQPYDPEKFGHFTRLETIVINTAAKEVLEFDGIKFPHRLMSVDVQADSFWAVVEAWSDNADSVTLYAGQLFTWADCRELQLKWEVMDQDVCFDQSHRGHEVVTQCTAHGHLEKIGGREYWLCWKALRGSDQPHFVYQPKKGKQAGQKIQLPYTWPPQTGDPSIGLRSDDPRRAQFRGRFCQIFTWSNPWIKDIAIDRRDGKAKGIKHLTARGDWNAEYNRQMHSQKKVFVEGNYGKGQWKWEKFRDDHLFDCKCMNIVRAAQRHLIGQSVPAEE